MRSFNMSESFGVVSTLNALTNDVFKLAGYEEAMCVITIVVMLLVRTCRGTSSKFAKQKKQHEKAQGVPQPELSGQRVVPLIGGSLTPVARLAELTITQRVPTAKALALYLEHKAARSLGHFANELAASGSRYTALDLYKALIQCAGRADQPDLVVSLLEDMKVAGVGRTLDVYESAMRLLATKKKFREALVVYDYLEADNLEPSLVTMSCLIGFALEVRDIDRARRFFEMLESKGAPSVRACMTMLRAYGDGRDWESSLKLLQKLPGLGVQVDSLMLNVALTTGVAAGKVQEVQALLLEESPQAADAVSFNIVMKGLAAKGDARQTLKLMEVMHERGFTVNIITVNTAMDAAVKAGWLAEAWCLYDAIRKESNLRADKCTCTTLVKALQKEPSLQRLTDLLDLADSIRSDCSADLTQRIFGSLLAVSSRLGIEDVKAAMRCFSRLSEQRLRIPAEDLWSVALLTARVGDTTLCKAVWAQVRECAALDGARTSVERCVMMGKSLEEAILGAHSKGCGPATSTSPGSRGVSAYKRVARAA